MFTKIEIKNFQSHKNTVIDFNKGVNVICGETDNGKSAVVRAIRWVVENLPSGTDKINSKWNDNFKEPLSVKLYTEKGWVERIRDKNRNGYNISENGKELIKLNAIGKSVPLEVKAFLNISDVNFQFQLDSLYLLSKTPGQASEYLNEIVHLDSIDKIMSLADSDKRQLNSEQKTVESDIKQLTEQLEGLKWVDEAETLYQRAKTLDDKCNEINNSCIELSNSLDSYKSLSSTILDLTEVKEIINEIEKLVLLDFTDLENSITTYKELSNKGIDLSEVKELVSNIDSIIITDTDELETSISQYKLLVDNEKQISKEIQELKNSLPDICPYCGAKIDKEIMNVC